MDYLIYNTANLPPYSAEDASLLPPEEQLEARRRGENFARTRAILRRELSRRTGLESRSITIAYGPHGKPHCEEQPFNVSHSGDCLCLAFHHASIGVDVERIRPRRFASLAERFMSPAQLSAFLNRGCPQDEFYACWCAAEALVKHAGDTMWHAQQYPFVYYPGKIVCQFPDAPTVLLFTPMPGYQGAVAYS